VSHVNYHITLRYSNFTISFCILLPGAESKMTPFIWNLSWYSFLHKSTKCWQTIAPLFDRLSISNGVFFLEVLWNNQEISASLNFKNFTLKSKFTLDEIRSRTSVENSFWAIWSKLKKFSIGRIHPAESRPKSFDKRFVYFSTKGRFEAAQPHTITDKSEHLKVLIV